ncbi:MAG: nickel pincer cofactor biosynthesis protein LarC [Gemmatimonadales bacterium]
MSESRFAILDPAAGVSGDMILGALIAAGAQEEWLRGLPARLGLLDVTVDIERVDRAGLSCTKVNVRLPDGRMELPTEQHTHPSDQHPKHRHGEHGHSHGGGDAPHRHVGELIAIVERAPLSAWVRDRAVRAFRLLGEAEGRIHGMAAERVSLHEVGAVDALVDIVGAIEGFERLGITRVYNRPVAVGSGWVTAAHGVIPVPAPATAVLLEGVEIGPNGPVLGEATTPTGAALLRVLSEGPPPERWRAVQAGAWGAGGRNPHGYANALRLIIAHPAIEAGEAVVLSTDMDDLSPEYLEPLREALFAAGALDVQLWATQSKKGRTGFRVEATVSSPGADAVVDAFFRHSTTAGLRRQTVERVTLTRRELMIDAGDGTQARVKVLDAPNGPRVKPEYDDVAAVVRRTGRPAHDVASDLRERALRQVALQAAAGPLTSNKES